jgi:hypothetical protein
MKAARRIESSKKLVCETKAAWLLVPLVVFIVVVQQVTLRKSSELSKLCFTVWLLYGFRYVGVYLFSI